MIFFSCGEQSGDEYASIIASRIHIANPSIKISGNGGDTLANTSGVSLLTHVTNQSTVGLIEPLRHVAFFYQTLQATKRFLTCQSNPIVVAIDHQGFNIPLAKWCRKNNIPVYSLFSPQYWMWGNQKKARLFSEYCTHIFCVFKQEYDTYQSMGLQNCSYVGHPILSTTPFPSKKIQRPSPPIIGIFPGSRQHEVNRLLPIFLQSVPCLQPLLPNSHFYCAVANDQLDNTINQMIDASNAPISITRDPLALIKTANASMVASGTITLAHAILNTPCVCTYVLHPISYLLAKRFIWPSIEKNCHGFIALPNILMKQAIVPELIQSAVTPNNIVQAITSMVNSPEKAPQFDDSLLRPASHQDPCTMVASVLLQALHSTVS